MKQLNINSVSRRNLIDLKGFGPVLADRIIEARTFTSESEIIGVNGIGVKSLSKIKINNGIEFVFNQITSSSTPVFSPFLRGPLVMRHDTEGGGHWRASRGSRDHLGIDIECIAGEAILSPIKGKVTKHGWPSSSKPNLRYVEVTGSGADDEYRVRLMYSTISDSIDVNDAVERGDPIGIAQAVSVEYGLPNMKDHVHFELFLNGNTTKVDPTHYVLE